MRIKLCALIFLSFFFGNQIDAFAEKTEIFFPSVEDQTQTFSSAVLAEKLTQSITARLLQNDQVALANKQTRDTFYIQTQLVEVEEITGQTNELILSVHLQIAPSTMQKTKPFLQEVFTVTTLMEQPLGVGISTLISKGDFEISPIGLAQSKLAREIASRIEEAIEHWQKGS